MDSPCDRWRVVTFDGESSPFDQPTSICIVEGKRRVYLLDTHTGSESIRAAARAVPLLDDAGDLVVVNTHSDWDHVWGNCAVGACLVVGHRLCLERMADDAAWQASVETWSWAANGRIERRLPDLAFECEFSFPGDGLLVFHSPGHSADSISIFDRRASCLFTGDNIEEPIPYLQWGHLDEYRATLERYLRLRPRHLLCSHSGEVSLELVERTLRYVEAFSRPGEAASRWIESFDWPGGGRVLEKALQVHAMNLANLRG